MELKLKMENVRKNPRKYLDDHMAEFESELDKMSIESLLALYFASASFQFSDQFNAIDTVLKSYEHLLDDPKHHFYYATIKGLYERSCSNNSATMDWFVEGYNNALILGDYELIGRSMVYLSTAFDMMGKQEKALDYAKRALTLLTKIDAPSTIADLYMNYGLMLNRNNRLEESLQAYKTAESYYNSIPDNVTYLNYCVLIINIGTLCLKLEMESFASTYIHKALEIANENGFVHYLQGSIQLISDYYSEHGQHEKAKLILSDYLKSFVKAVSVKNMQSHTKHEVSTIPKLNSMYRLQKLNEQLNDEIKVLHDVLSSGNKLEPNVTDRLKEISEAIRLGEFMPFYQAKWSIQTQSIKGAEMLARWKKSDGRFVSPTDFIEQIENNSLMLVLGELLIRQSIMDFEHIIREHPEFRLSINISPYQLVHQDLVRLLESVCIAHSVPSHAIEIEIIERTFIENNPVAIEQLFQLSARGFVIALDDFGSGYSSLACLNELPIDVVKIDRSLVKRLEESPKAVRLFMSIVTMLKELGISTIAEGIETEQQLQIIKKASCDEGQGYLIHKPCAVEEFYKIM